MSTPRDWQPDEWEYSYYVYRAYSRDGELLYIGQTNEPITRFSLHEDRTHWWPSVHHVEVSRPLQTRQEAKAAEAAEIRRHNPPRNSHIPRVPQGADEIELDFKPFAYVNQIRRDMQIVSGITPDVGGAA